MRDDARSRRRLAVQRLGPALAFTACLALVAAVSEPARAADPAAAPPGGPIDQRAEAERHFQRGLELAGQQHWDAALAEFLISRELYPTRSATRNAAIAELRLGRPAESLELYQGLLREFANAMTPDQLATMRRELADVQAQTAEVRLDSREPGVGVALDGKSLGTTPLAGPIRVNAGTHRLRLSKDGFESSEQTFSVAAGIKRTLSFELRPLSNTGRLVVKEASGRRLAVLLDGSLVGATPWSAAVSSGSHTIALRGDGGIGTAPGAASVRSSATLVLVLDAVPLDGSLRVVPTPSTAAVYLDGVLVGGGVWEGPLPSGSHSVEVSAVGHALFRRKLELRAGQPLVLEAKLAPEISSERPRSSRPTRLYADFSVDALLASSLRGGADGACSCTPLALGASAAARLGYDLAPRIALEVALGALTIGEKVDRSLQLTSDTHVTWTSQDVRDSVRLSGPWAAVGAASRTSGVWPFTARLSLGAALLRARTSTSGTFATGAQDGQPVFVAEEGRWLMTPFISAELRVGRRLTRRLAADIGVGLTLFVPEESTRRGLDQTFGARAATLQPTPSTKAPGVAFFPDERVAGTFLALAPGASLRLAF